jgi:hypothetical protein
LRPYIDVPVLLQLTGVGVDELVKHGLLDKCKQGPLYWVDTADSEPCIGTGGIAAWQLTAHGERTGWRFLWSVERDKCAAGLLLGEHRCSMAACKHTLIAPVAGLRGVVVATEVQFRYCYY